LAQRNGQRCRGRTSGAIRQEPSRRALFCSAYIFFASQLTEVPSTQDDSTWSCFPLVRTFPVDVLRTAWSQRPGCHSVAPFRTSAVRLATWLRPDRPTYTAASSLRANHSASHLAIDKTSFPGQTSSSSPRLRHPKLPHTCYHSHQSGNLSCRRSGRGRGPRRGLRRCRAHAEVCLSKLPNERTNERTNATASVDPAPASVHPSASK